MIPNTRFIRVQASFTPDDTVLVIFDTGRRVLYHHPQTALSNIRRRCKAISRTRRRAGFRIVADIDWRGVPVCFSAPPRVEYDPAKERAR